MSVHRQGFTLIEVVTSLAILSTAMISITLVLHTLFCADERLRDALAHAQSVERLSAVLRQDAHAAGDARLRTGEPAGLVFTLPRGRSVTYTSLPSGIERVVRADDRPIQRESYRVTVAASDWRIDAQRKPPLVTLRLVPAQGARELASLRQDVQIVASTQFTRPLPPRPPVPAKAAATKSSEAAP